jgi:hypothetical protein
VYKHNVLVVQSDSEALKCLVSQIKSSDAIQVLVTGPMAGDLFWEDREEIDQMLKPTMENKPTEKRCAICGKTLSREAIACPTCGKGIFDADISGSGWTFFGPPYAPTRDDLREAIASFACSISREPQSRHIYLGPAYEGDVVYFLFLHEAQSYTPAVYILGLYDDPFTHLNRISQCFGDPPRVSGDIISIYSTSDRLVTDQFKRRLAIAQDANEDLRELSLLYFRFIELIKWLGPDYRESSDKKFIRNIERTLDNEILPLLFPKHLFPETQPKPWWRFW